MRPLSYLVQRLCHLLQSSGRLLHSLKFQRLVRKKILGKTSMGKLGIEVRYVAAQKYWGRSKSKQYFSWWLRSNNYSIEACHKASVVLTKMSKSSYLPWTECAWLSVSVSHRYSYFLPVKNFVWSGLCFAFAAWLWNLGYRSQSMSIEGDKQLGF